MCNYRTGVYACVCVSECVSVSVCVCVPLCVFMSIHVFLYGGVSESPPSTGLSS